MKSISAGGKNIHKGIKNTNKYMWYKLKKVSIFVTKICGTRRVITSKYYTISQAKK